ncbi:telomeric repeat-binding factor 1 [Eucyclogobius newberryi]|uniref:telomeric repeat-binding factor 1 n=1 Tax=Eucyclogobius newberryi TaxID=166745 RepID=UPI003B5C28DF
MEKGKHNITRPDFDKCEENVSFSQVTAVATDWMMDFLFISLCRSFKDGNLEEFNKQLSSFEAINDGLPQNKKVLVCAFLARVMHGEILDVSFEDDHNVLPLMSAAKIWSDLKKTVEDEVLAKNITILLIVQSVAVCLEKGSNASYVIQWLEKNLSDGRDFPSTLRVKLGTVVAQKDNYHPLIKSFSYSRLLETTNMFLNEFLERNPSDYLFKAATKAVQSSGSRDTLEDKETNERSPTESTTSVNKENEENTSSMRSKRKLLSTKTCDLWTPETGKKPFICLTRLSKNDISIPTPKSIVPDPTNIKKRKPRTKWTWTEDKQLIAGVKRHGLGQWSHILQDFNFGDRTGTMLKDRWRTLKKARVV